jgi:hypothetical protein
MYPESVSVERSDRERKGEWIEQDRGSTRKDTIGPKYGQVTLTGIKRQTRCRLCSRTSVLTSFQQYSDLSLSLYIPGLGATRHQRASWPTARRSHRLTPNNKALYIKGVQDTTEDTSAGKLGKIRKQGQT